MQNFSEHEQDLMRVFTCGSVDDGKSTLIGRLLFDSKSIFQEQLQHIEAKDRVGDGELNLALLTDGLKAEREQGITIDVAYKYFSTPKRKFILADTPGHVEYTRNMVTGASLADCAIILIDARQGILEQTRRHSFIAHLLRVPTLIVCVNKMDLIRFSESEFRKIEKEFHRIAADFSFQKTVVIPISALKGDNIVHPSTAMPWFNGQPLLKTLEETEIIRKCACGTRFTVQYVLRPQKTSLHDFRGFAGILRSGTLSVGNTLRVEPSGKEARVSAITYSGKKTEKIFAEDSAIVELDQDIDVSRGDILTQSKDRTEKTTSFKTYLTHLDTQELKLNSAYFLQYGTQRVKAMVKSVEKKLDLATLRFVNSVGGVVSLNDIAEVTVKTAQPILFDTYDTNWATGAGILIHPQTHKTSSALMFTGLME